MLTVPEKILFLLAVSASGYGAFLAGRRIMRIIRRGLGRPDWSLARRRFSAVLLKILSFQPVFRTRLWPSIFHGLVGWGFIYYLLVNIFDITAAFFQGFHIPGTLGNIYRLGADVLSAGTIVGMLILLVRRFVFQPTNLAARTEILLHPKARPSIRRDSAIVGGFILIHVGARLVAESFKVAGLGGDPWQPVASGVANLWSGLGPSGLVVGEHVGFWVAIGSILGFVPYFLYSKHLHLIITPINFLVKPERRSTGELSRLDFDDESIEQFGATYLEDLGWEQILDAYACIMCNRCQEVCPAYNTGKVLSPAALEINKRYFLNTEGARMAQGEPSGTPLTEFAITPEAIWACTACGACNDICPVGNEPMRDILDIRRGLVLMENNFPEQLQAAFRGMERSLNPWNIPPTERMAWTEDLNIPTVEDNPEFDLLWWVGCAPATDARAQKTARALAKILTTARLNFAVLGEMEQCTGDSARRAGNEFLFNELALANVEILNTYKPARIITTCPHCLHTLKNEYPAFGGSYEVVHHTQVINELLASGKLPLQPGEQEKMTFHDPCYLGRQNDIVDAPRQVLDKVTADLLEMPRHGKQSFCCGAGGAQMWKEEEKGRERVSTNRIREAVHTGASTIAVGCPFCMIMLTDAGKESQPELEILDIAEIIANRIK